jgi:hypothetical protein
MNMTALRNVTAGSLIDITHISEEHAASSIRIKE